MTAKKRVISIISIISLILAITVGLVLTVGAQTNGTYDGGNVNFTATDVTINAQSSVNLGEIPSEAAAIDTAEKLQSFIKGEGDYAGANYGYLTADVTLDWSGVGSQAYLASGRTIDGNGHTVTLEDAQATANVSNKTGDNASLTGTAGVVAGIQGGFTDPLDGSTDSAGRNYGMFVDFNMGTIKNIKFVYSQAEHSVANNGVVNRNYSGIVCGTNAGTISNCDLTVSGEFGYYYCQGALSTSNYDDGTAAKIGFANIFGGIAGRNGGTITNITAQYSSFNLTLNTRAQNSTKTWGITTQQRADAKVAAGGIAGVMYSNLSECSNIIILSSSDVKFTMTAQRNNATLNSAVSYREAAAVVPGNSAYSQAEGGIGDTADSQGKVDNIIIDFRADYSGHTMGDKASINAVVFCGKSTNVTILNTTDNVVENQHVDYQTDNCNCGVSGNGGQHEAGYGNLVHTGEHSNVTIGIDADGNQVITVEPKDKEHTMLGEIEFMKYTGKNTVEDGSLEPGIEDTDTYANVSANGSTYLYNKEDIRFDKYTFTIRPYQGTSSKYWEVYAYSYEIATISNVGEAQYTYNGSDFLANQLSYTTLTNSKSGAANPECYNARTDMNNAVTEGRLPGEYTFTLQEIEAGLSYIDTTNKVVAFVEDQPTEYSFVVNLAQITPIDASLLADNWLTTSTQDFTFELTGGLEGAFDGYSYIINGSLPTPVEGAVMQNRVDTTSAGRTYTIYLTSGGVKVTQDYTYTVKVDATAPTAEIVSYEHPADRYYTHNTITVRATDRASGVASIVMNSYNNESGALEHSHDLMSEGTLNSDGTYSWRFQDTGRKEIVVTDNVGHSSTIEVNVKIDTVVPTLDVQAYYYKDVEVPRVDADGLPVLDNETNEPIVDIVNQRFEYVSGTEITSAVYFEANATFGESGGEIKYSLDNGKSWIVYDGIVTVKSNADVKFLAVSNTYTHPDDDEYPYPNRYPLANNWGNKTVEVRIQLEQVVITLDDLDITNATKTFDGTNAFYGSVAVKDGFVEAHDINGEVQITSVVYADINAGESVELIISVFCTDDTKVMDNQIVGATGTIEKKVVDIEIDSQVKIYGVSLPQLTYTQSGMVEGFEENIPLYVQKPEGYTGTYELLPQTENGEGYVIAIVDGTSLLNYTLGNITEGRLRVTLAPVDRLVYDISQYTGLDTSNIADRNLEIGFTRSNGNYERLNVTFYARNYRYDTSTGEMVDEGYTLKVDDITKAGAGFFRVVLSLPEYDAAGELLTNKYVMADNITEFMIKVIDASIFDVEEEAPSTETDSNAQQNNSAVANNTAGSQVGFYQDGVTDVDNTDSTVEMVQQKKDYVAMISIFCTVAIVIAFAIGVGRAVYRKARK